MLASALVATVGSRPAFYFAFVPGIFAAIAITVAAAQARKLATPAARRVRLELAGLRAAGLTRPLLPIALFELGNTATTLLILRATDLLHFAGRSLAAAASLAISIYAAHNAVGAVVALIGGRWIDAAGARVVFATGAGLYVLAYLGFAVSPHSWLVLLVAFCLAGSAIGLAEAAESTLVAQLLPDELRGSGFGVLGGLQAVGDLAASAAVGLLWTLASPTVAFLYAAGWMALSLLASVRTRLLAGPSMA